MRKIALIGTGSSGVYGPYEDETYEIWGVASRFPYVTRAERWFELHRLSGETQEFQDNWRRDIKGFSEGVELYMLYPEYDLGPKVIPYPYQHIVDRFGTYFMTSSFAWMLAMAIDELRPENGDPVDGEIGIWGVDLEYGTEYTQQRAGFRHFVDVCRVLGITVTRFADTGLSFEPIPYPLWQDDPLLAKLEKRKKESGGKLKDFNDTIRRTRQMIAENKAVIEEIEAAQKDGYDVNARMEHLAKEYIALMKTSASISKDLVFVEGVESEQRYWKDYLSP